MVMDFTTELTIFLAGIREDPRIGPTHISLFVAILQYRNDHGFTNPVCVFGKDLMLLAKISAAGTYHRSIRDLHEYGYIQYIPSYNHFLGSLIYLPQQKAA
jgi:hypothetical protein